MVLTETKTVDHSFSLRQATTVKECAGVKCKDIDCSHVNLNSAHVKNWVIRTTAKLLG